MKTHSRNNIDGLVDENYLGLCDDAWSAVRAHSKAVLESLDAVQLDPSGVDPEYCFNWLKAASEYGVDGGRTPGASSRAKLRAPSWAASRSLLERAAESYLPLFQGITTGQSILLSGDGLQMWYDYFHSSNSLYYPLNAAPTLAVFDLMLERGGARILEVGSGTGGAASHLLDTWPVYLDRNYEMTITDASPRLLMSTRGRLRPDDPGPRPIEADRQPAGPDLPRNVELEWRRFDFDRPAAKQGFSGQLFDVILAVNALHNATDLSSTLRQLTGMLQPDGALVMGESICGPGELVHQELFLNLLPMPPAALDRGSRFYSSADWQRIFDEAGVRADIQVNSIGPELVLTAVVWPGNR